MTFSGRIRLFLLLTALTPPLAVLLVLYFHTQTQIDVSDQQSALENLARYNEFFNSTMTELRQTAVRLVASDRVKRAVYLIRSNRTDEIDLDFELPGLDFLEILDSSYRVRASRHRPGLVRDKLVRAERIAQTDTFMETIEYDIDGPHAAFALLLPAGDAHYVYTGRYLDSSFTQVARQLLGGTLHIRTGNSAQTVLRVMEPGQLYRTGSRLEALLAGNDIANVALVAEFQEGVEKPAFRSLLYITGLVALAAVLLAGALGFYVSQKAKREIDNLVEATHRIASGDLATPVMAYEEGEFATLADSFTDMTFKLKRLQHELATSEKIAAWQVMGRKIAHEIKNPLTPIAISTDDLRRSYAEQDPNFKDILAETTMTIKSEIGRLTRLLDQFVGFARMKPPRKEPTSLRQLIDDVVSLYRRENDNGRLLVLNSAVRDTVYVDPETMKQVLINLIKNGLEASEKTNVTVTLLERADGLVIHVEDNGPGFPEEMLEKNPEPYVSTKVAGSGLGLVISHRIVHDHGGTLELSNRETGGAGVTIILPRSYGADSDS